MKLFKKTLAMVLAMAMLSSAAVFPAFATEEDPADVSGVEDVVEEPIAEEPDAEEPVVEEPTVESPADQEWDTWDFGSSTYTITATNNKTTISVGDTTTLTGVGDFGTYSHSWSSSDTSIATVSDNGWNKATVTGVSVGKVKITHTYYTGIRQRKTEEIEITVVAAEGLVVKASNGTNGEQTWTDASGSPFTYPSTTSVTVGGRKTLSASAVYTNSGGTTNVYSVSWASGDTKVATVTSDGVVKGVAEGTATITATLTCTGLQNIVVNFLVKVTEKAPELDRTYAYYYLLKSDATEDQTKDENWSPFGIASVSNLATPTSGATSYPNGNEVLTSLTPAPFFPAEGTDYENHYAKSLVKESYPTYIKDGKTYIWVNDPGRDVNDTDADGNPLYAGTFEIIWFRVKAEDGAGCNRNTNKGDVRTCTNAWVESDVRTWHVDGKAVTKDKVTVKFMVKKPGATEYVLYSSDLPLTYAGNTRLSAITAPSAGTTLVNGVTCDLSDWYMDADLTQLKSANGSKTLSEYDTDGNGIIEIYAKYIPYTVTYQYKGTSSDPAAAAVDKVYMVNIGDDDERVIPLPYGPNGDDMGEYFAGWTYRTDASGTTGIARGNSGNVAWVADADNPTNMTITAVYYSADTAKNYVINSSETEYEEQSKISSVETGAYSTPLFGAPEVRMINGQKYVIAKFNADFTAVAAHPDDGNDADTGTVIAENGEYKCVGFVLATAGEEVATSPTVQGGYSFTESNDVFQSIGSESLGGGFYIVIKLGNGVNYATPYAIANDGNDVYYYGTALEIQ